MFCIHGHELAVRLLWDALGQGRLHHAYLFSGPAHVGKRTLAIQLAQAVNCAEPDPPCGRCASCQRISLGHHTDIRILTLDAAVPDAEAAAQGQEDAEGPDARASIGLDAVHALLSMAYLKPYEGRTHVFIIEDADRLTNAAANALLKLLEEPPPELLLVLLTANMDAVLPTIISRCQVLELRPLPLERVAALLQEQHGTSPESARQIARLSKGCVGWAIEAVQGPGPLTALHQQMERITGVATAGLEERFAYADGLARRFVRDRAAGRQELSTWLQWWRDVLLVQNGQADDIVHTNWRGTIESQAQAVTRSQALAWLRKLYENLDALEQNANPRLVLEALMLEFPEPQVR